MSKYKVGDKVRVRDWDDTRKMVLRYARSKAYE